MAEMKDSGIEWVGEIPKEWKVLKNKYNFELSKEIIGTKWVETQLLSLTKYGVKAINDGEQTGKVPESLSTYQKVNKDDIVMCLFDLDCSAVFSGISNFDGMISPAYKCIRCKPHLCPQYVDYYFRTVFVDRKYKRYSKNVRFSISSDEFMNLPIIVPPIDIQKKIAEFLNFKCFEIDTLHSDIEKQIKTLEEYKKQIITEAVTKGLDPDVKMKDSGISVYDKLPITWNLCRIKDCCQIVRGGSPRPINNYMSDNQDDINWIRISDTTKGHKYIDRTEQKIKKLGMSSSRLVHKGDLLLTNSMSFGQPYILNIDGCIHDGWLAFSQYKNISKEFLFYTLMSELCAMQFVLSVSGSVVVNLNIDKVGETKIFIPNMEKQKEIVSYLDNILADINDVIEEKKEQLETLEQYKESLICEYVTGKKEVK